MNILITGGTSGLGYRTAYVLAQESKNKLILIGSNNKKGEEAIDRLIHQTKNNNIKFMQADLSSIKDIQLLAKSLKNEKIDILINNAGALFYSRIESIEPI